MPPQDTAAVMISQPEIVTSPEHFKKVLAELSRATRLSLDIESDSFYHYDERVCIVTLSTEDTNVIVDSLALGEATRELQQLVGRKDRPVLMHSASNDVLALKRSYRLEFGCIQDTALAGSLLGFAQTGLATLVETYLGMRLPKELQRHDWGQRPLAPEHQEYLVNDTRHLFKVHDLIEAELRKAEIIEEYQIECRHLALSEPRERGFDPERFRRIKGHDYLDEARRGALKALYAWRDRTARALNRAPFRVISDHALLLLATDPPKDARDLASRGGVGSWLSESHADEILQAIAEGLKQPAPARAPKVNRPPESGHKPLDPRQRDVVARLKAWREKEAAARGLGLQAILPTPAFADLVHTPPADTDELGAIARVGKARARRYGEALLALLAPLHKRRK